MKNLIFLTLLFASCSTYNSTSYYETDDRYTSVNDQPVVSQEIDTTSNSTVIVNNYYDNSNLFYTSRIRGYQRPFSLTYHNNYYIGQQYYTYDPNFYGWNFYPYIWYRPSYYWNYASYSNWHGWSNWNYYGWNNWHTWNNWNYYGWNNMGNPYGWNHCGWNNWHQTNWNNPVIWGPHTPIYTSFGKPIENNGKTFQSQSVVKVKETRPAPVNKYTSVPVRSSQDARERNISQLDNRPSREVRNPETRSYTRPTVYEPQRKQQSYSQPQTADNKSSYIQPQVSEPRSQPARSTYSQPRVQPIRSTYSPPRVQHKSQPARSTYSPPRVQSSRPTQHRTQPSRNVR